MKEKELTDEEIVKALENTKNTLDDLKEDDDDYEKLLLIKKITNYSLDLIRRLQSENADLLKLCEKANGEMDKMRDEKDKQLLQQKAEIERLTEEIKSIKKMTAEQVVESEELKQSCAEAVNSFVRLETLYKVKCKELEIANKKLEELKGGKAD